MPRGKAKKDNDLTTFVVGFDNAQRRANIYNEGQKMDPGFKEVGTFQLAIDKETNRVKRGTVTDTDAENTTDHKAGDHIFITETNRILKENGITDFQNMRYEDKASNAPLFEPVKTIKEVEDQNRANLQGTEEDNEIKKTK